MFFQFWRGACVSLLALGCGPPIETKSLPVPASFSLKAVSGDAQSGSISHAAHDDLVLQVCDLGGNPIALPAVMVDWRVSSGVASLLWSRTLTDMNGQTSNTLTFGSSEGQVVIGATIHSTDVSSQFTATALPLDVSGLLRQSCPGWSD